MLTELSSAFDAHASAGERASSQMSAARAGWLAVETAPCTAARTMTDQTGALVATASPMAATTPARPAFATSSTRRRDTRSSSSTVTAGAATIAAAAWTSAATPTSVAPPSR